MKPILLAICALYFFNQSFAQSAYAIEGKWKPEGFSNTLYILASGWKYCTVPIQWFTVDPSKYQPQRLHLIRFNDGS